MFQSRALRVVVVVLLVALVAGVVWLRVDLPAPKQPLFAAASSRSIEMSPPLTELARLGEAIGRLRLRAADGTERDVIHATGNDARARAAEYLHLEVVAESPSEVATAIAALRRESSNNSADPEASWRPLLLVGKVLSLRAEAMLVSDGPDAAWGQVLQGFDYADALFQTAGSVSQIAMARSIRGFFAQTVSRAIATRAWPPAVLLEIATRTERVRLGPLLLRSVAHEYASAMAMARSDASPVLLRPVLFQPNRTEDLWSKTLGQAVRALSEDKPVLAYRMATGAAPVREQVPIFGRNWLGYKRSVPAIQSCIAAMALIANAELQTQLLELAANAGRYQAEIGELPPSLQMLVKQFPDTDIRDPWLGGTAPLQYDSSAGVVYSVGVNRTDDHMPIEKSFDASANSDDYGVRLRL